VQFFWLFQRTRFLRQHDRDAVADRIGQLCRAGNQLLLLRVVFQRALGQRADEDFQKFWVDTAGGAIGWHGVFWALRGVVCPPKRMSAISLLRVTEAQRDQKRAMA